MATAGPIVDDLRAESDDLDGLVADLPAARWADATPAPGWTIAHQISHLLWTDRVALLSVDDEAGFNEVLGAAAEDPAGFVDRGAEDIAATAPAELLAEWRATRHRLHAALLTVPDGRKLGWFGPPMSAASMATARLMETWAHGLDVADALGVKRPATTRLRSIAHIGVRTRDFAFAINGLAVPADPFRVDLRAPDGSMWSWGPEDAPQRVVGSAEDFCFLVTQRRPVTALDVTADGDDARTWLTIAQAFAGSARTWAVAHSRCPGLENARIPLCLCFTIAVWSRPPETAGRDVRPEGDMDFYALLDQVVQLLRSRGRVSYPALQAQFGLSEEQLQAVRTELRYAHAATVADDAQGLTWIREAAAEASDAERRQLTVLFCDLVDSTRLSHELDPEDFREVMRAYYESCGKVIERFDGYIAQYLGDGLLVFFGYPRAHEDDAQRAVRAGLEMISAVRALSAEMRIRYGVDLLVRLGCHTGRVVVGEVVGEGRHELMAAGDTPNIAARLQSVAEPNTLVIGPVTHQLVGGFFDCRSLGTPPLKGVATRMAAYQVLHESSARTRLEVLGRTGLTPLVGRSSEVAVLEDHWAGAVKGRGHVVVIDGEAGIGKSRLAHAITQHAVDEGGWLIPCQGSPYHRDTALYPFIDLFNRVVLRSEHPESPAEKVRRLTAFFTASGMPLDDCLPQLCALLSLPPPAGHELPDLPPDQQKQQTLLALQTIVNRRADQQPVLLVVEDLHWIDPTTVELLTVLIEKIRDARILALFTCRPEFDNPWSGGADIRELQLTRLSSAEASELVRLVAGGKTLPDGILSDVVVKTDGIPLFIEELTKTLLESDLLTERAGRYELAAPLPPLAIPDTLHDSLMARLDRLSTTKGLAQLGAAIGREFSFTLLKEVSPWSDTELHDGLSRLVEAEFLFQQGTPPDATYRFKHALIQDAAYQSLLKSTRQRHHQRIAAAIESGLPDTVENQPELLAHHYTEAGLVEHAVPYWYAAAKRALNRHANEEACNHATRGLALVAALPDGRARAERELGLQLVFGAAKVYITGPNSVEHVYSRACDLARELNNVDDLFPALAGLAYAHIPAGRMRQARSLAEEILSLAEPRGDRLVLAIGHWLVAYAAWWQGDVTVVREHSRRCLTYYDPTLHLAGISAYANNPGVVCGYLDPLASWALGYPTEARTAMETALTHATALDHPQSVSVTLLFAAQLAQLRRDPTAAMTLAEQAMAISTEHGLHALTLWCLLPRGWAKAQRGDVAAGISDICEAMDRRRAFGMGAVWPWYLVLVAEAYGMADDFDNAFASLDEALQWVARNDERLYAAEAHRIRGDLLLRQPGPDPARAQQCYEQALSVARAQQARSWELRAATSLARMWLAQGRRDDAREVLAPVFHWFTEGFDTADLQDAGALLDQLS